MRPMPSPETTATTLVVGGGPGALGARARARARPTLSRTQRSSSTCSSRSVTLMRCGPPGVDAGLDGRADVVGVDVAVPEAVAADHDDGVADAGPHLLEGLDGVVRRAQEVHDLVAQVPDRVLLAARRRGPRSPAAQSSRSGR